MRKYKLLTAIFILPAVYLSAQNTSLHGTITDTASKTNLVNTTIVLLQSKDSALYKYTRSKADGNFELNNLKEGKYVLMITHSRYADYYDTLTLKAGETKNLGSIMMTLEANLLADVTVRAQIAAMRMRGDTLEYAADSFHVRQGATVEDLLKNLPGIQVDKSGKITAQGEQVQKVLVDGEEFFGDDPTVATQNLGADIVDKVQVFDKKSDQAEFTGIDDGQKTKTINLKLKADKKKGYFGKLDVGEGTNQRWNNSGMINDFKGKEKISAYGIMSSTGRTGLNWDEQNSYGSGDNGVQYDDDFGGFYFNGGDDEFSNSNYYGEGVPKSWAAGLNYANKYYDDKLSVNGSYRFNKLSSLNSGNTFSQSILPDSLFYNTQTARTFSSRLRHSLNGTYEQQIDSSFSIKFTAKAYTGQTNNFSDFDSKALDAQQNLVSQSVRSTSSSGNNSNINANLLLRKKFKKIGRTASLNISEIYNGNNTDGYLYSVNSFYNKGIATTQDTTDEEKRNNVKENILNSKFTYTEPIIKNLFAELNYGFRLSTSKADNLSYDRSLDGKYSLLNDTFSSRYQFNVTTNTGGAALKYSGKKITFGAGADVAGTNFHQNDLLRDTMLNRNYLNFFPRSNFVYKLNQTSRISLNYSGRTQQPTITEISPVADNTNPLLITVGNPSLKQEFIHNINFNANTYKVLKQTGFYMYGSVNLTANSIVNSQTTDTNGITTYKYVNASGNYSDYFGFNYFKKFIKLDLNFNAGINFNSSRYSNFVNNIKNQTDNSTPGISVGLSKSKEKKYDISYWGNINYNISKSSINSSLQTKYFSQEHNFDATVYLPWKFEINTNVNANLRQKTALFNTNNDIVLLNGFIGRKFLKNDKGLLKLYAYDILNQNKGYSREINTNVISENNYQTVNRYFMLSFVWNFSKTPPGMGPQQH